MATMHLFRCPKCGYEIETEKNKTGEVWLMSGIYRTYRRISTGEVELFHAGYGNGNDTDTEAATADRNPDLVRWNPVTCECPKCQKSKLRDKGVVCFAD